MGVFNQKFLPFPIVVLLLGGCAVGEPYVLPDGRPTGMLEVHMHEEGGTRLWVFEEPCGALTETSTALEMGTATVFDAVKRIEVEAERPQAFIASLFFINYSGYCDVGFEATFLPGTTYVIKPSYKDGWAREKGTRRVDCDIDITPAPPLLKMHAASVSANHEVFRVFACEARSPGQR